MLQLKNDGPFKPSIAVFPDRDGVDTLYVVIRATFDLAPGTPIAEQQSAPATADEYWGEPGASSLKFASELHIGKPTTDVVLVGSARSVGARPVAEMPVSVQVAERRKVAMVIGNRVWRSGGGISSPEPFTSMPLTWENAYGGSHRFGPKAEQIVVEERNPVGRGFPGKRSAGEVVGQPLPNVEHPHRRLKSFGDPSDPVGFGFVAASWLSRRNLAGTYDKTWQRSRAPYLPRDFNARFLNAAPPDLIFDRFLEGGEVVRLIGFHPGGLIEFALPTVKPKIEIRIAGTSERPLVHLETALLEPDSNRFSLTFRAQLQVDRKVLRVEKVTVE